MKFNIVAGSHKARVEISLDGKGGFTGAVTSDDFGKGDVAGLVTSGNHLTGAMRLDGHAARLDATFSDKTISGRITAGWFFSQDFTGEVA